MTRVPRRCSLAATTTPIYRCRRRAAAIMPPERCRPSVASVPIVLSGKGTAAAPASCHRPRVAPATTLKSQSLRPAAATLSATSCLRAAASTSSTTCRLRRAEPPPTGHRLRAATATPATCRRTRMAAVTPLGGFWTWAAVLARPPGLHSLVTAPAQTSCRVREAVLSWVMRGSPRPDEARSMGRPRARAAAPTVATGPRRQVPTSAPSMSCHVEAALSCR